MDLGKCLDGDFLGFTRDLVGVLTNIKINTTSIENLLMDFQNGWHQFQKFI
jgi:hypothetical protein